MKTTLVILCLLIFANVGVLFVLGILSWSEKAPGIANTRLTKCSNKPNCICSEHKEDAKHYITPISIAENESLQALSSLKTLIQDMGGKIELESDGYLAATFSSAIFKFVDDIEIRIDSEQNLAHIRSASRVGYSDMGVNRQRIERLKTLYINKNRNNK